MSRPRKDRRHRAREATLQILYHWEVGGGEVADVAATFFAHQWPDREPPPEELRAFASLLAAETVGGLAAIDPIIAETTDRWRPERMAILDRLVLRMAIAEMMRDAGPPAAVVINEALELARTYSGEESVKFINGILDAARKKLDHHKGHRGGERS